MNNNEHLKWKHKSYYKIVDNNNNNKKKNKSNKVFVNK